MSEYAMCEDCGQTMAPGAGCLVERVQLDGIGYPRQPYQPPYPSEGCYDCGVAPGQYHHPGCDMEVCPVCEGQLISCEHVPGWEPYKALPAAPTRDYTPTVVTVAFSGDDYGQPGPHTKALHEANAFLAEHHITRANILSTQAGTISYTFDGFVSLIYTITYVLEAPAYLAEQIRATNIPRPREEPAWLQETSSRATDDTEMPF